MFAPMSDWPLLTLIFITFALVLAGVVKGVIAMGLPTIGVGLLSIVMPPSHAAAIIIIPATVTNVLQLFSGPRVVPNAKRFWALLAMLATGTLVGGYWLGGLSSHWAPPLLGLTLSVYGVLGLRAIHFHTPSGWEGWLSPVIGLASGFLTGTTGVTVMPSAPYLQSLALEREDLIQALGLTFTVANFTLAFALTGGDAPLADPHAVMLSLIALVPALIGMEAGRRMRLTFSPATFKTCFFAGLLGLGVFMLARGLLA
ncbi:TSUP family transporter [Roseixanthobacter pseudopolyaromaticivorans]|uniref:TSUP family transporter n=1 Tax=Xanthobacteraceae TaxID=335928 RepID=UPI00372A9C28